MYGLSKPTSSVDSVGPEELGAGDSFRAAALAAFLLGDLGEF